VRAHLEVPKWLDLAKIFKIMLKFCKKKIDLYKLPTVRVCGHVAPALSGVSRKQAKHNYGEW
jgi:hypothetical protein